MTLGVALEQAGRGAEARVTFEQARKMAPHEPTILTNLGLSYLMAGDAGAAEKLLREAAALPGATAQTRQNLAVALGVQGRFAEAERLARVDLPPEAVADNMAYLRALLSDGRRWGDLRPQ